MQHTGHPHKKLNDPANIPNPPGKWSLDARKVGKFLIVFWGLLIGLHFLHHAVLAAFDVYWKTFDLNKERNLPTYAQGIQLLAVAALLYLISQRAQKKDLKYWFSLSLIFVFLAMDEVFQIHDQFNDILKPLAALSEYLFFPWVVIYAPLLLFVGAFYIKFLLNLPRRWAGHMVTAGFIYVTGALAMEILGAPYKALYGHRHFGYAFFTSVEEIMEIAGIMYFAILLIYYIQVVHQGLFWQCGKFHIEITPDNDNDNAARQDVPRGQ